MLEKFTFYFVCSFAAYGVCCAGFTLWDRYQMRKREEDIEIRWLDSNLSIDDDDGRFFDDIVTKLCDPAFFPPGDSDDSVAAPEGNCETCGGIGLVDSIYCVDCIKEWVTEQLAGNPRGDDDD